MSSFASADTQPSSTQPILRMEINGRPYYIKSKNDVPYIYDIDTHDEVGYWSSKKGAYVMFSLYNKLMNDLRQKKEEQGSFSSSDSSKDDDYHDELSDSDKDSSTTSPSHSSDSKSETTETDPETDPETDEEKVKANSETTLNANNKITNYSLVMLFLIFFLYLTLQKEVRSIYFDLVFLILISSLNIAKVFEIQNND